MLSVMLVDDESLIRRGLKKLIDWEQHGFRINKEASNGEEALELISNGDTDIIVTDLKMPAMDGLELSTIIESQFPTIKVIVLTGYDEFEYLQESIRIGVADYLLKPVSADLLIECLQRIKKQIVKEQYRYPFDIESKLLEGVKAANQGQITEAIQEMFNEFHKYKTSLEFVIRVYEGILLSLDRLLEAEGSNLKDILRVDNLDSSYLLRMDSKEVIREELLRITFQLCDHRSGYASKRTIQNVIDYIEQNFQQDISLRDLAAKFYLNPSYLSQLFKSEKNENFSHYLSNLRIEKAKKLIGDPNLKIQDISELVGYGDSKYFSQLFKKITGMLPSEYRNNYIQNK